MGDSSVCSSCGAELPGADAAGLITCPNCGRVTKADDPSTPGPYAAPTGGWPAPAAPAPPPGTGTGWAAPPVAAPPPGGGWSPPAPLVGGGSGSDDGGFVAPVLSTSSGTPGAGCVKGAILGPIIALVVIAAVVALIVHSVSDDVKSAKKAFDTATDHSSSSSMIALSGSTAILPGGAGDGGRADVVMVLQDSSGSKTERTIGRVRFDAGGSKLLWQSEPLADDAYRAEVAVVGDTLFAGVDDHLLALDATTGKTRWSATLHDKVTTGCPTCFAAVDGNLVVRTTDAYVTGYGTKTGEPLWSKRLRAASATISPVGDRLFIVDDPEDAKQITAVDTVDPATGKVTASVQPACPKSSSTPWDLELSAGDTVEAVAGSSDVVAAFGFGDSCVVRWAPGTGKVLWTSRLTNMSSIDEDHVLQSKDQLVLPSSGQAVVAIDLGSGKATLMALPDDLRVVPDRLIGHTLIADTTTSRGTARHGLMAWDVRTGDRLWDAPSPQNAEPVSRSDYHSSDALFDGSPRLVVIPTAAGATVMTFEGTDGTFSAQALDVATGDLGTPVRRAFLRQYESGTPSVGIEGIVGDRLLVSVDSLIQTIPVSGKGELVSFPDGH